MESINTSPRDVSAIIKRYRSNGLFGGLFFGVLVGIVVAGPHFHEWSAERSMLTIIGSLIVGGLVGYLAGEIAIASLSSGPGSGLAGGSDSGAAGSGESSGGGDGGEGD
jgi:uncharacterized membrane protein YeaQ/YmgE (transglycosylase-associated protein family)